MTSAYIELTDFWISITRKGKYPRGMGKWMLFTADPQGLYEILREGMKGGKLESALSVMTRKKSGSASGLMSSIYSSLTYHYVNGSAGQFAGTEATIYPFGYCRFFKLNVEDLGSDIFSCMPVWLSAPEILK